MRILSVGRAFPSHYYDQQSLLDAIRRHWSDRHVNPERLERLHKNALVTGRHMVRPIETYEAFETWGEANDVWIQEAPSLAEQALGEALDQAGLAVDAVDLIMTTTVTGLAVPSLDALLMNRLPFRRHTKRVPLFGLGCAAGAAGLGRVADYLRAFPDQVAVLLSVELCSLTVQKQDLSIPNLIATSLFGDAAAAVVMAGEDAARQSKDTGRWTAEVVDSRSVLYPDTERALGWDISERGFQIVLSAEVPDLVGRHLRQDIDRFLADHGLERHDIAHWICHPGGPKVLQAVEESLELPDGALDLTWRSFKRVGNLSSASVLAILKDTLDDLASRSEAGSEARSAYSFLLAMGPGFSLDMVLLNFQRSES